MKRNSTPYQIDLSSPIQEKNEQLIASVANTDNLLELWEHNEAAAWS